MSEGYFAPTDKIKLWRVDVVALAARLALLRPPSPVAAWQLYKIRPDSLVLRPGRRARIMESGVDAYRRDEFIYDEAKPAGLITQWCLLGLSGSADDEEIFGGNHPTELVRAIIDEDRVLSPAERGRAYFAASSSCASAAS
jgi:hypothetical protein